MTEFIQVYKNKLRLYPNTPPRGSISARFLRKFEDEDFKDDLKGRGKFLEFTNNSRLAR